ncbi:MAG: hypothetical protein IRZ24_17480, partial [Thermogemmatispora sp.]
LDVAETAEALYTALTLPSEERERRAKLARQIVEQNNLHTWLTRQIEDINELLDLARLSAANEERQRDQDEAQSEPELAPSPLSLSAG